MKRFFATKTQINNNQIVLDGTEHNHLKNVLRLNEGERVIVVVGDEYDYECNISKIAKNNTLLEILERRPNAHNPLADVTVFQALTKQENMNLIVQKLNELGVKTFVPFESRYITSKDKFNKSEKLQTIANQSVKQCKRSIPMAVSKTMKFSEMLSSLSAFDVVIFANETDNKNSLDGAKISRDKKIAVIIGSEGGFSEDEITQLTALKNLFSVGLGKRILRAETASIALTSVVMYLAGEWNNEV